MATKIPLSSASDLSSASTISSAFATAAPFVSTSPASIQNQLRALFWPADFRRKEMAIAALCGAASIACVYCGTVKSLGMWKRGKAGRERQRGAKEGGDGGGDGVGGGLEVGERGDSSYGRPSTGSGAYSTSSRVLPSNIGSVPVLGLRLCVLSSISSARYFPFALRCPACCKHSCTLLALDNATYHVLPSPLHRHHRMPCAFCFCSSPPRTSLLLDETVLMASQDAPPADASLLRKHSEFISVTTERFTYPAVRVFYRTHPKAALLPQGIPLVVFIHGMDPVACGRFGPRH
jgi:hypothetical protein